MDPNDNGQAPPPPEAPDKEKMEQIRRRRMEKLSGPVNTKPKPQSEETSAGSVPEDSAEPVPKTKITIRPAAAPASTENPFTKLTAPSTSSPTPPTVSSPSAGSSLKRPRAESSEQSTPRPAPRSTVTEDDIPTWEHKNLSHIFRITVDPNQLMDSTNHKLTFLPNLRQELEEDKEEFRLSKDRLDSAIVEAVSTIPHNKSVLDYLLPCFKRITKLQSRLRGYANEKDAILKEARRLCVSYCIFGIEVPELFGREKNFITDSLTPYFLFEHTEERGICMEFLTDLVARFEEDDTVKPMLMKAVTGLSYRLSKMTMNDQYKPYIDAFKLLTLFNPIVTAMAEEPLFLLENIEPQMIETSTLLGPLFRISPLQAEVTKIFFKSPKTLPKSQIADSQNALRLTLQAHQRDLLDITNRFIKSGVTSRNRTLDWLATIMNQNHKRRAMQVDSKKVASDAFMINITVILDGLCEPFMDTTFSKVSKIDIDYLRRSPRVDISDETKLNADQNTSDEFYSQKADGVSNFISEVFFLNLAAHHYGSEASNAKLKTLDKDIKHISSRLAEMEAERPKFAGHPDHLARFELQLKPYIELLDKSIALKLAIEGVLFDKLMQAKSLLFMRYVTVWLLRIASQSAYTPDKSIKLPLSAEQPIAFKNLPEYVLEDIIGNFTFISKNLPDIMVSANSDELIALCTTFLTNSDYVKNPYLKAKLVSLLYHGSWPVYHRTKGILGDALTNSKFANDHLLHALMKFYIEVESTGTHTQFYDKFNIRYEIFQVIKVIWSNPIYKQRLQQESSVNKQFFLRFVTLLLNDATYVLDEALSKFPKIHDLEGELDPEAAVSLTAEERTAKEEELTTARGQAQSYMQLTNETMAMMVLFTKNLSGSFTQAEIVDRVAAMLNYTLDQIVGAGMNNLKVKNPEHYQWRPKALLSDFIDIYLNLGAEERFISAVARDGRSYKPVNYQNAAAILKKWGIKSPEEIAAWEKLKIRFSTAKELDDQEEEDYGEIPDEYLDPILATLMLDPVILPTSRNVVDRSTIQGHLLSDPNDPFNRMPLKIEDVIEDLELKAKITVWREEMRAKANAAREAALANAMDTSA